MLAISVLPSVFFSLSLGFFYPFVFYDYLSSHHQHHWSLDVLPILQSMCTVPCKSLSWVLTVHRDLIWTLVMFGETQVHICFHINTCSIFSFFGTIYSNYTIVSIQVRVAELCSSVFLFCCCIRLNLYMYYVVNSDSFFCILHCADSF
jgi:hypothetical protein